MLSQFIANSIAIYFASFAIFPCEYWSTRSIYCCTPAATSVSASASAFAAASAVTVVVVVASGAGAGAARVFVFKTSRAIFVHALNQNARAGTPTAAQWAGQLPTKLPHPHQQLPHVAPTGNGCVCPACVQCGLRPGSMLVPLLLPLRI